MKLPLQSIRHILHPRCAVASGGGGGGGNDGSITTGVWNYKEYGKDLQRALDALEQQSNDLALVKCYVREETKNKVGISTQEEADLYNQKMFEYCQGISTFIAKINTGYAR